MVCCVWCVCGVWCEVWALRGLKASTFKFNFPFLWGGFKRQLQCPFHRRGLRRHCLHSNAVSLCYVFACFVCWWRVLTLDLKNDAKKLLEGNGIMDFKVDAWHPLNGTGRLDFNVDALTLHTWCAVWRVVWALMGLKASTFKSNFPFLRGGFKHQLYNPMSLPSAGVMRQLLH